jgi:hypothetical protein
MQGRPGGAFPDSPLREESEGSTVQVAAGYRADEYRLFQRAYLSNAYRVLLTRARQGMVIYVPRGDDTDGTRPRAYYNGVAAILEKCGVVSI